eukprot:3916110-Pleurochrysis_carterae.AAC.1
MAEQAGARERNSHEAKQAEQVHAPRSCGAYERRGVRVGRWGGAWRRGRRGGGQVRKRSV